MSEEAVQVEPQVDEPVSEQAAPKKRPSRKAVVYTGFSGFLLFLFAMTLFFYRCFKTIEVQGDSMEPTLHAGERLLISNAYWLVGPIKDNDIVVIKNSAAEDEVIIKRVYKVSGETVDLANVPDTWDVTNGPFTVDDGKVYVLGDNRPVSQDSRYYGPFDLTDVIR